MMKNYYLTMMLVSEGLFRLFLMQGMNPEIFREICDKLIDNHELLEKAMFIIQTDEEEEMFGNEFQVI